MNKKQIIELLRKFISQRSGIDFGNYGSRESLMQDYRTILRDGKQARTMLRAIELRDSITVDKILSATRAFAGRLSISDNGTVDYCTGQYFPTEYRAAVCSVLAQCLWDFWRPDCKTADAIREQARRELGRGIANRWFN